MANLNNVNEHPLPSEGTQRNSESKTFENLYAKVFHLIRLLAGNTHGPIRL